MVRVIAADLATDDGVGAVIDGTRDLDTDVLVAAAGFGTAGSFLDLPIERELEMLAVNCRAPTALAHAFGLRFRARGGGAIILLSSILGFAGVAQSATYAATKGYMQSLAEGLRDELAPFGIAVQAVAPGPTHSGFAERAGMTYGAAISPEDVANESLALLGRRATVRPGLLTKVLDTGLRMVPRRVRSVILSRVIGGMLPKPAATASA
jgi:short-subunit dehydrogenase